MICNARRVWNISGDSWESRKYNGTVATCSSTEDHREGGLWVHYDARAKMSWSGNGIDEMPGGWLHSRTVGLGVATQDPARRVRGAWRAFRWLFRGFRL